MVLDWFFISSEFVYVHICLQNYNDNVMRNYSVYLYVVLKHMCIYCTFSSDSVLSESTGLFNPVPHVSQLNFFCQKIDSQIVSFKSW